MEKYLLPPKEQSRVLIFNSFVYSLIKEVHMERNGEYNKMKRVSALCMTSRF